MKIRMGFVSNSSSSSFLVIKSDSGWDALEPNSGKTYIVQGRHEFGWGPEVVQDIKKRIAFAALQAKEYSDPESGRWDMIVEVIKENSEVEVVEYALDEDSYIDHQSAAYEGENEEIFENKQKMKDFIFGRGSYIQLDNDNH